jgi:NAD(P)-dependent dehydrogenase (short-subunit alcohol dehydrogenase family)
LSYVSGGRLVTWGDDHISSIHRTSLLEQCDWISAKKVLVTAGASGIGLAIARAFVAAGSRVLVIDVDKDRPDALNDLSPAISTAVCDISRRSDIERVVPAAVEALGGLDVVVNNAGFDIHG